MWVARQHAGWMRARLGRGGPVSAEAVCRPLGLHVLDIPMPTLVDALTMEDSICVREGLPWHKREHCILHELGHFLICGPGGGYHFWKDRDWVMLAKAERRAEEFAYFFALPGDELLRLLWHEVPEWEIAEMYHRSVPWLRRRAQLGLDAGELNAFRWNHWAA